MALAGKTASVDIPKPRASAFWTGKDSFAAVAARSLPPAKQPGGLPTPPNSISPSLPPQKYTDHASAAPATPPAHTLVDSDIDLQDAVDHAKAQDQPQRGLALISGIGNLAAWDTTGAITPGLLAKHHLPEILLSHGPLAIRHVMGYLTTSVPGFSGIPPAKARRLVVGALEGRGSGGEGGGINGDVEFEKVGWGRWDARRRGNSSKSSRGVRQHSSAEARHPSPSFSSASSYNRPGLRIPRGGTRQHRARESAQHSTYPIYSHDTEMDEDDRLEEISIPENEVDKMSLDGDESCSSSEAPDEGPILDDDLGDVTDEEDWASIGAAALRQGSFPLKSGGGQLHRYNNYNHFSIHGHSKDRGGGPASSALAKSMPMPFVYMNSQQQQQQQRHHHDDCGGANTAFSSPFSGLPDGIGSDSQEREAIEALVRLSSV
ncbi:DNA-binding proteins Bright/BRCAA1/RBP1 and proteins containing BRIGHT domain [Lignoscripta atroalba]|nr:DNA-binding proteins Bright/BRCAA1/RBP1 and proteins containing BRIGHT domain [Lignoscripta atroalba]